jgi:dolichol-phosphate mannosyltransferase
MSTKNKKISIVIPCFNEEPIIEKMCKRLKEQMEYLRKNGYIEEFDIILVDDGSTDKTWALIKSMHKEDKRIKGMRFAKNCGQHFAIMSGVRASSSDAVIVMDADLQETPEEIQKLLDKSNESAFIVWALREESEDPLLNRITSWVFSAIFPIFTGIKIPKGAGNFSLARREVIDDIRRKNVKFPLYTALLASSGFLQKSVRFIRKKRGAGRTKYNFLKRLLLAEEAILSFSSIRLSPLYFSSFLLPIFMGAISIYLKNASPFYASLFLSSLLLTFLCFLRARVRRFFKKYSFFSPQIKEKLF